jgi:hypothetical protein
LSLALNDAGSTNDVLTSDGESLRCRWVKVRARIVIVPASNEAQRLGSVLDAHDLFLGEGRALRRGLTTLASS